MGQWQNIPACLGKARHLPMLLPQGITAPCHTGMTDRASGVPLCGVSGLFGYN